MPFYGMGLDVDATDTIPTSGDLNMVDVGGTLAPSGATPATPSLIPAVVTPPPPPKAAPVPWTMIAGIAVAGVAAGLFFARGRRR